MAKIMGLILTLVIVFKDLKDFTANFGQNKNRIISCLHLILGPI